MQLSRDTIQRMISGSNASGGAAAGSGGGTPYILHLAADGVRGGIQIGYTQTGQNYPVQLDGEKAYVNVPWTDHYAWADITNKPSQIFYQRDSVSDNYVNGTTYETLASGTYKHAITGASESMIHFQHEGSASGLDIKFEYQQDGSHPLKYRKNIDSNSFASISWVSLIDSLNIGSQSVSYATSSGTATYANSSGAAQSAGYATEAGRATNDGDGNAISSTYLKLSGGTMTGDIVMSNAKYIKVKDTSNRELTMFGITESNYVIFGMGTAQYHESIIDGHQIRFRYWTTGSNPERKDGMILTNAGRVGIGTLSPSYDFHVVGKMYATDNIISETTCSSRSDVRMKEVLGDVDLSVEDIARMPAVRFRRKNIADKEREFVGSIAQAWQKVLPQTVEPDENGMLTFASQYAAIVCVVKLAQRILEIEKNINIMKYGA